MMRSMFAGVSGLRSHQTMMDVVGNNIANVNTAGYKSAQITFGEAMAQTLQGPAGAGVESGGTNPLQIGLGVQVASIDGVFTQGAIQITGRPTDRDSAQKPADGDPSMRSAAEERCLGCPSGQLLREARRTCRC